MPHLISAAQDPLIKMKARRLEELKITERVSKQVASKPQGEMMDVLVGSIDGALGERFSVYLRTLRGRRVVSFEVSGNGSETPECVTQLSAADLGKLQPLLCGAVLRSEDERRGARW